jgi:succinate-semialdehyde dehydrogenase/glutarate-semialdehyde dehydrogenase
MVLKPAHQTPLSMHALAAILAEVGLPDGVLNLVTTSDPGGVMEPLIRDGRARKLSFTGSTAVGKKLLEQCSEKVLRTSMELGGNAPFLVFDDADLDKAVEGAMLAKMRNMGEACTAANRFLVQRGVAEEFARRLTERMGALVVGRGTDDGVQVGPLVDAKGRDKVVDLVRDAVDRGATVHVGGEPGDGPGYFYRPTVLSGVPLEARLTSEEIFGPVAAITVFDEEDEALTAANDTEFGLVSYLYTENITRALRVSERLEAGMIGLNTGLVSNPAAPFGGIKESGLGREGGSVGIEEFLETKYVAIGFGG